jgi:hypothetical protein
MTSGEMWGYGLAALFVISLFLSPFRRLYTWCLAWLLLNDSSSPLARKFAHKYLGYTWDEFGAVVRM